MLLNEIIIGKNTIIWTLQAGQDIKPGTKIVVRKKSNKFEDGVPRILAENGIK